MQQVFDERVLLTDGDGRVLADSQGALAGQALDCETSIAAIVVSIGRSNCIGQPNTQRIGYSQLAQREIETGDVLFMGMPVSTTLALNTTPISAALSLDTTEVVGAADPVRMIFRIGAWEKPAFDGALPAITIRRTTGRATDPIQAGFISAVNRSLLLAVGAAGLAALLLTIALSRRILGPIEALTAAARKLEQGDLSQRVAAHSKDEIGELARAFNAMADGLARIEQLRRHMVTDVAHELRTPLTNIRGYLEALRDGVVALGPPLIDSLHEEALLLNRLIDDLQDLALAEAGQLRLARRPTALATIVEQAVSVLRPALDEKCLAITVELPATLPPVDADAERVGQVLRNLLNNAITHTPEGGSIRLYAAQEMGDGRRRTKDEDNPLQSFVLRPSSFVTLRVCDGGPGIAPEHLALVFERFFRADPARARATGGAGLGLTIVRQLVEAHGGRVWAESTPGLGATFAFTLPVTVGD
jgi:signal transduction histidine kinase